MSENDELAVEIEGVKRHYGHIEALRGVDMQVKKGTIFGLLGANGAGKTTLIKILVGTTRLHQGRVRVLGLDPAKEALRLRNLIGYMPQAPALYEDLSARENIKFFGAAHYLPDLAKRVEESVEFTGLSQRANDVVSGYSGGMKQRVSLACALVHRPQALFLDEPTAGVDPKLKETFWHHFRELASQGVTLFISTHLMDEALLCDQLAIMRDGQLLECDTPRNIMLRGNTNVKIWRDGILEQFQITDYPTQLPGLLERFGLDRSITHLELDQDTLETIMLQMINGKQPAASDQPPVREQTSPTVKS